MTPVELFTASSYCFFALLFAAPVLALLFEYWPRSPEQLYRHRLTQLMADMRRRGLSVVEMQMEMRFRYAMVELSRRASQATLLDPCNFHRWVDTIAKEIADRMMPVDPKTARGFLDVVHKSATSDILTPAAARAILREALTVARQTPRLRITDDDINAVTTR